MSHSEPETETEHRERRRDRRSMLVTLSGLAGIAIAIPTCLAIIGDMVEVSKAPAAIREMQARQNGMEIQISTVKQELSDIKWSLERIERALRIPQTNGVVIP